jgi:hypothetical protein
LTPSPFFGVGAFLLRGYFLLKKIDVFAELIDTYIDNRLRRRRGAT